METPEKKSFSLLFQNIFYKNVASNVASLYTFTGDFCLIEKNVFIENYCSKISPYDLESGVDPSKGTGIGLFSINIRSYSMDIYVFFKNDTFIENFAKSRGLFEENNNYYFF